MLKTLLRLKIYCLTGGKYLPAGHSNALITSLIATFLLAMPANAQSVVECIGDACLETDIVKSELTAVDAPGAMGFSISVDGDHVAGDEADETVLSHDTVSTLSNTEIQVKFDGLDVKPILNISTIDVRHTYQAGDKVQFLATSNYPAWITSSKVLIYKRGDEGAGKPLTVIDVSNSGIANWQMPIDGPDRFAYVLRAYDELGRFDETFPLGISRSSNNFATHQTSDADAVSPGNGEDRTAVRNIQVYGGAVTIYGKNVPNGYLVHALGEPVPVDKNNNFVIQRILPPGDHAVDVNVGGDIAGAVTFNQDINIPRDDWFYVALADVTVGKKFGSAKLLAADPRQYGRVYKKGRLAFYLKGKIKGRTILTAAADTGEGRLQNLFNGLDAKDPRQLLRRIDPSKFYPVYGDDSTSVEDAPTSGKFYVKLERGDSHVMWGNFKTKINGSEFVRSERALYGASAVLRAQQSTSHGERVAEVRAYASKPGTLPQRDSYRGTGGSAYFLSHQDITHGSETITIEARDLVTGLVISRKALRFGEDYDINYVQGVLILKQPVGRTASDGHLIGDGATGENGLFVVTQYEYTPATGDLSGYSYGGRAHAWLGDNLRIGASVINEETGSADQQLYGADIHLRLGKNSFVEAEIAQSTGPGFDKAHSINGGLTINDTTSAGSISTKSLAYRVKGQLDLSDIDPSKNGIVGAYFDKKEAEFSSLDYSTTIDRRVWGAFADVEINDVLRYGLTYEDYWDSAGKTRREGNAEVEQKLNQVWMATYGVKYTDLVNPGTVLTRGNRTDIGVKLTYTPDEDLTLYGFAHKTVHLRGNIARNDRYGLGGEIRLSEKVSLSGEVSNGTSGWGGLAALNYDPTADDHYYIGYKLDPNRDALGGSSLIGTDLGGIVVGAKSKYNDTLSAYIENNYDMFGRRQSLTSTYGIVYTPTSAWAINGGVEYGTVEDPFAADIERTAISASLSYQENDDLSWRMRSEARFDRSTDAAKYRDTFLASAGATIKANEDWRALANLDVVISRTDQISLLDGDYIRGSWGYAYRPVDNDKLNMLAKYTFLYDFPGPDQVTANGNKLGPAQRSHVFNVDGMYAVNQYLTLGAKYGFRIGEISSTRSSGNFAKSSAHLGILRADIHVVNNWDILFEGRILDTPQAQTTDFGALVAVYHHVGKNMKVGLGYNFGKFSDDLTDLTYDDGGVFLNVVGKF